MGHSADLNKGWQSHFLTMMATLVEISALYLYALHDSRLATGADRDRSALLYTFYQATIARFEVVVTYLRDQIQVK